MLGMEEKRKELSCSFSRMPSSGGLREGRTGGIILTKKVFTLLKAARSSRSMLGRLAGKSLQLFSDSLLWSWLAPTPARKTRQQRSAELGMVVLCLL